MPNVNAAINDQIRKLSRREIKDNNKAVRKATTTHRRDIAALKRQIAALRRSMSQLARLVAKSGGGEIAEPSTRQSDGPRFRANGLRTHRAKLGLSAADYGRLVGVAGLTIYNWEKGQTKPRAAQLAKLSAVRRMGKRAAKKLLASMEVAETPSTPATPEA